MGKTLDPNANYVVVSGGLYGGHTLVATHPVSIVEEPARPGEFTTEQAQHLLNGGRIQLGSEVRPTPVERPEDAVVRLSTLEPTGDGKFLIRAPWLPKGAEIVKGSSDAANARLMKVREEGLTTYNEVRDAVDDVNVADQIAANTIAGGDALRIEETGSNGYYTIVGAPDREPERVRGKANAERRLAELRTELATAATEPTIEPQANPSAGPAPDLGQGGREGLVVPPAEGATGEGATDEDESEG
jgi:hypothetical protein